MPSCGLADGKTCPGALSADSSGSGDGDDGLMRRRVVRTALIVVTLALLVFAIPLAVAARFWFFGDERGELEREALAAAVQVGPQFGSGDPVELPASESDSSVGVYDVQGRLQSGRGPAVPEHLIADATTAGSVVDGQQAGQLIVAVPVSSAETVVAVIRASVPVGVVWKRIALTWLAEVGLAGGALLVALLVARRQARTLSAPLESLSAISQRIADGDMSARAGTSAIPEISRVAQTHNAMVERLTFLVERGRDFTADASHQLRTPLAGLQLGLESALDAPDASVADLRLMLTHSKGQVEDLHRRLDDVLRLAQLDHDEWPVAAHSASREAVADLEQRWHGRFADQGRRIGIRADEDASQRTVPTSLIGQVLDVLADNAFRHGRGSMTVTVREIGDTLAIDVADEGTLALDTELLFRRGSSSNGSGIGLALARQLTNAVGGRLVLARRTPTTFTLLLTEPDLGPVM